MEWGNQGGACSQAQTALTVPAHGPNRETGSNVPPFLLTDPLSMRILKSTTCLTPIALLLTPGSLSAQLTISTATTVPVRTATAVSGAPADINIVTGGSITLNAGSAVTVDSNNSVNNAGTITQGNADNVIGIDVQAGLSGTITNGGAINIVETFNAPNTDGNAIVDGPIAQANNRTGILVRAGGAHTGNIVNTGAITIDGLNSAGIRVNDTLTGSILTGGAIKVRGDGSVGMHTESVTGNIVVGGPLQVVGKGAVALDVAGDVGGTVRIVNAVGQQATFVDDNGASMTLARSDLNVGAPAVALAGNIGGGLVIAAAPTTSATNPDNDGDGVADNLESVGAIQSFGNGPALRIGNATRDTTIGAVTGDGHGIVIAGTVNANAFYSSNNATAIQIGGLGGNVTVAGGISVKGTVQATTIDAGAAAILINAGSSVPVIDNSGAIRATISSPGQGSSYGIRDLSGTLTTINNSGFISASGTAQDTTFAIDLSANTSGVTINQTAPSGTAADASTISPTPLAQITGNIITGSGNDVVNLGAGAIIGNSFFGAGNDTLALSRDAVYQGRADFGAGNATLTLAAKSQFLGTATFNNNLATLTLGDTSQFRGDINGGANLSVAVNGGTLEAGGVNDLNFKTLTVGANGTIKIDINTTNHTNARFNVDTATFASGSRVAATVNSLADAEGTYVVLTANQITGMPNLSSDQTLLPFLFKGTLSLNQTGNQILLDIDRKTATELGLTRSAASAYSAILAAAPADAQVAQSLLGATDQTTLQSQFDQLLPDNAGGNFDFLLGGSRAAARHLTDNHSMFSISELGGWLEATKWSGSKDATGTAAFSTSGFGVSGGIERTTGIGNVGLLFNVMTGKNDNDTNASEVKNDGYEFGAFWRVSKGPFYAFARGTVGFANFGSTRTFLGVDSAGTAFGRQATASWKGRLYSGMVGASYMFDMSERISLKPMAIVDYYHLHEKGYTETGGALTDGKDAIDLTVAGRTSKTSSATTTLTGIYRFGSRSNEGIPLTIEAEGGRRNVLGGDLGNTTAHFQGGTDFVLTPDKLKSGWLGELRLLSGGLDYTWQLAGGAEQTAGSPAYNVRFSLSVAF